MVLGRPSAANASGVDVAFAPAPSGAAPEMLAVCAEVPLATARLTAVEEEEEDDDDVGPVALLPWPSRLASKARAMRSASGTSSMRSRSKQETFTRGLFGSVRASVVENCAAAMVARMGIGLLSSRLLPRTSGRLRT